MKNPLIDSRFQMWRAYISAQRRALTAKNRQQPDAGELQRIANLYALYL